VKKISVDGLEREADVEPMGHWHVFDTLVAEMGDAGPHAQMYAEVGIEGLMQMLWPKREAAGWTPARAARFRIATRASNRASAG
jgi:hypothetical protein